MSFDDALINCAMPTLCGIKPSSLFSMKYGEDFFAGNRTRQLNDQLNPYQKKIEVIHKCKKNVLYFVYDLEVFSNLCLDSKCSDYLLLKGYPVKEGPMAIRKELYKRLVSYREDRTEKTFPHEVGLFLGYPLCDVIHFEKNDGQFFSYSGYWKVYENVETAQKTMQHYRSCSEECKTWYEKGLSIIETVIQYKNTK